MTRPVRRVAVVGAGWAGLAAAVRLAESGQQVTLIEMAPQPGGRARGVPGDGIPFDNGQHILIGAYSATLALMRRIGVDPAVALHRQPLTLRYPDGSGLALPAGAPWIAFVRGVLGCRGWTWRERAALLAVAGGWLRRGFRCDPGWTVARLCAGLPARVSTDLIEPLCVAALNTPAAEASAEVLLRVLHDALFSGPGAADLLLPRQPLDTLLPAPAVQWLRDAGAELRFGQRVAGLAPAGGDGWALDGERFDAVVLACSAAEAARLTAAAAPAWAAAAAGLRYEPIVTVYLQSPGTRLAHPMMALRADADRHPAQFVFDHGALGGAEGRFAFVVSGAAPWVARGRDAVAAATLAQAETAFAPGTWASPLQVTQVLAEKRATFRCTPALARPAAAVQPGLWAAGDHVQGPYPATLEGAVRAGETAARGVLGA